MAEQKQNTFYDLLTNWTALNNQSNQVKSGQIAAMSDATRTIMSAMKDSYDMALKEESIRKDKIAMEADQETLEAMKKVKDGYTDSSTDNAPPVTEKSIIQGVKATAKSITPYGKGKEEVPVVTPSSNNADTTVVNNKASDPVVLIGLNKVTEAVNIDSKEQFVYDAIFTMGRYIDKNKDKLSDVDRKKALDIMNSRLDSLKVNDASNFSRRSNKSFARVHKDYFDKAISDNRLDSIPDNKIPAFKQYIFDKATNDGLDDDLFKKLADYDVVQNKITDVLTTIKGYEYKRTRGEHKFNGFINSIGDFPGKLGEFIFNAKESAVAAYKDANTPEWAKE